MACQKICFTTRAEARQHARKNLRSGSGRPYKCQLWHGGQIVWHLTSQTAVDGRRISRKKALSSLLRAVEVPEVVLPTFAPACRCERPQPLRDEGEVRCLNCGRAA